MSSGHGVYTKRGRCFPFWKDYMLCRDNSLYPSRECGAPLEDFMECLHHRKERARMIKIIEQLRAKQALLKDLPQPTLVEQNSKEKTAL